MGLFGNKKDLAKQVEILSGRLEGLQTNYDLEQQRQGLLQQVADLEIKIKKDGEDFARERREIEHKLGLEKQRQESDLEIAKQQAELDAREKWLENQEDQFDEKLEWFKTQTQEHQKLSKEILTRLPKVTVKQSG